MNKLSIPLVVGVVTCMLLAGCVPSSDRSTSKPPGSTAPSNPKASSVALTCENLVTAASWSKLTSDGSEFFPDFDAKAQEDVYHLGHLFDLGGIACQWGVPGTDNTTVLAFARVTAEQAAEERRSLATGSWKLSTEETGSERWVSTDSDNSVGGDVPGYEFGEGSIRFALDSRTAFALFAL